MTRPDLHTESPSWPLWRKLLFRFFFVFVLLAVVPTLANIPGFGLLLTPYTNAMDWIVKNANRAFLHVRPVLVPTGGSGDTSYGWAELWTNLILATTGCFIWSLIDYRRASYTMLNYLLCVTVRYYIVLVALLYGYSKVFLMQMPFPNISQLATPLGDFLPMRLSWMFIGYSGPYQFFSGCMEVLAGLLLLFRRTATLGAMVAVAVFGNVLALNLSYDIPVKIFSMQLTGLSLFLLLQEWPRISAFFIYNRPAGAGNLYTFRWQYRWMRITRVVLKVAFVLGAVLAPFITTWNYQRKQLDKVGTATIKYGLYDVAVQVVNGDTLSAANTLRWKDIVFDAEEKGSVKAIDTAFTQRYGRGYFNYTIDTAEHRVTLNKYLSEDERIISFQYAMQDANTINLQGSHNHDTLYFLLKRNPHHFQLTERQFHWLSESNR